MTRFHLSISSVLLATSLGFAAMPASAAMHDCGPLAMHDGKPGKGRMGADHMHEHHNKLYAALKLAPEQEGAWTKFVNTERPLPGIPKGDPAEDAKLNTPARAEKMLERIKEHQGRVAVHVAALKEFYAVLTPLQQTTFDEFHTRTRGAKSGNARPRMNPVKELPKQ